MTRHSAKQIQEGWATFLRVLARDSKLKFVIGRNVGPATDGKTVWLPALPAQLTKDDLIMFKSNAFHEIGHIQHSNITWFQEFAKKHGSFAQCLLNALDDVFMERRQARFTKPAERYFRESARIMAERKQFRDGSANAAEAVCCYCLVYLFSRKWPEYRAPLTLIEGNFDKQFGEHAEAVKANLNQILDSEFVNVRSTEDAGKLALRIIAMLKEQSQREEEEEEDQDPNDPNEDRKDESDDSSNPDQSGDQDDSETPDDNTEPNGSGSGKGSSTGSDDDDASGDPAGAGNGLGDVDAGEPEDGQGTDGKSDPAEGDDQAGKSLADIVQEMLEAELGDQEIFDKAKAMDDLSKEVQSGKSGEYSSTDVVRSMEVDGAVEEGSNPVAGAGAVQQFVDGMPVCPVDRNNANELLKAIDRKADVLAGRLRSLLLNREEAETYTTRRGRLGQSHLYRLGLDDSRVFEQQDEIELPTAAVSICADLSGSTMVPNGCSITCAESIQHSLLLLEKVLEQLETPREIIGFAPTTGELNTVVRTFGDSHRTALDRIGGLASVTGGYHTPIGEAVFQAASRLEAHESQRKILFVLTDGDPSCEVKAAEMTQLAVRGGIEVVYLLIGDDVRSDWLTNNAIPFAHAITAGDLCPVLLDKVGELLG
ncbi:hypothetical protein QAO71_17670 (plasmid) [Halopseudomonas sp. SMJS2]|uniref:hypothetical protein n=1 Tax=Halopseudomonas sp. SMJS2 TaxID=3041098 RepID=UPI002452F55E|nr:hypothetical protein [Halopseudomonas sp. SMJS2]WGK63370.1 hypothetical protein QAO71_17670 [Halopseudomonas sp. SMJS2]